MLREQTLTELVACKLDDDAVIGCKYIEVEV